MATVVTPLAEAGYYVMPVSMVDETFKQNGLTTPNDIQEVSAAKLREIFGADAAVYIRVKEYGTKYLVIGSDTRVTVEGRIVDLRNGAVIWEGKATASSPGVGRQQPRRPGGPFGKGRGDPDHRHRD